MIIYIVKNGDTITSIANLYGVDAAKIIEDNNLLNADELVVGQTIVIITDKIQYTIKSGDSLYSVARRFGISLNEIMESNPQITEYKNIPIGTQIVIPIKSKKLGKMKSNGYALSGISEDVLKKTLPHLTYVSVFSYQIKPDGELKDVDDEYIIKLANQYKVAPLMTITNIEEGASFSGELANTIFLNKDIQNKLINNIITVAKNKGYYGVDCDFEYLFPEDKDNYNSFIQNLKEELNKNNLILNSALAPKTYKDQPGVLYEAHDYNFHGKVVDNVILMTYEWGYLYGPPMAVAPINSVKKVLNFAVNEIPTNKILMGIPNYGYDWNIPYVQGSAARVVTNLGAVKNAWNNNAAISFDYLSKSPFYKYYANGQKHIVWFEDARSIRDKLQLVADYNLGGVSYWNINNYFAQNWLVQDALFTVEKVVK